VADPKSSTKAADVCPSCGEPGASARIPSTAWAPTWPGRLGETSWSLPHAVLGCHEPLDESAGASCEKPLRPSIRRTASGLSAVIC
jgi:hypothetical protein